jgi:uncharacterized SAM-binding protein YcdF (DUF218 family)
MRLRRAIRTVLLGLVCALAVAWLIGLAWFANSFAAPIEAVGTPTDAIVVLTGGSGRIEEGINLLRAGAAPRLFVSGVEPGVELPELLKRAHIAQGPEDGAITLGHDAETTAANAAETAAWMREQKLHSLRLVTANYHMRRSLLEFRHAMPEMTIIAHPVFPETVKHTRWWAWPGTLQLVAGEYMKYLLSAASLEFVGDEEPR